MSRENVEVLRRFYEVLNDWLTLIGLIRNSRLTSGRGWRRSSITSILTPSGLGFSPETFRGREQLLQAVADWLETVSDWRVAVEELIDGSRDRVLTIGRVVARGKGSGTPVHEPIFTAVTVRNGKIARRQNGTIGLRTTRGGRIPWRPTTS